MSKEEVRRIIVLGSSYVGKSSIVHRYTQNSFKQDVKATIGVKPSIHTIKYDEFTTFKLHIWDTAGDSDFTTIVKPHITGANVVIFVFALDDRMSFEEIPAWINRVDETLVTHRFLVGNKCDKESVIKDREINKLKRDYGLKYYETSAKTGKNIQDMFGTILYALDQETLVEFDFEDDDQDSIQLMPSNTEKKAKSWWCCC